MVALRSGGGWSSVLHFVNRRMLVQGMSESVAERSNPHVAMYHVSLRLRVSRGFTVRIVVKIMGL
jgi:hypothetical protein